MALCINLHRIFTPWLLPINKLSKLCSLYAGHKIEVWNKYQRVGVDYFTTGILLLMTTLFLINFSGVNV